MAGVIRRRYLAGTAAAVGGLLAAACGEAQVRYVEKVVEKRVEVPVEKIVERKVEVPVIQEKIRLVEKEVPVIREKVVTQRVEVPVIREKIVEKRVEVPAPPPKKAPATLDFQHRWNGKVRETLVQKSIDMFMAKYPHITVNVTMNLARGEGTSGGVPIAKLLAQIAAGQPPDVVMIHASAAIEFAERNALTWLDTFLARDKVDRDKVWFPAALPIVSFRGQVFALPQTAAGDYPYLFWNKALTEASGIDLKQFETWNGLVEASKAMTRPKGDTFDQIGYPFPSPEFVTWITVNGGEMLSADGRKAVFSNAETIEALTWQTEAPKQVFGTYDKYAAFLKQFPATAGKSSVQTAWANQKIGVFASGPWQWVWTPRDAPELRMDVGPLPVNTNNPKSKVTTLAESVWTWAMGAGLKDPDASWLLQKWMSFEEGHRNLMVGMGRATMVRDVLADPKYAEKNPRMDLTLATLNRATPLPQSKAWGKVKGLLDGLPADVLVGTGKDRKGPKLGVRDAVGQAAEKAQVELDRAYRPS